MSFDTYGTSAITVSIRDDKVVVDGKMYTVDFGDARRNLGYDLVSWNNGSAGFTQAFPGIRVKTFNGTEEEYTEFVAPYVELWEEAKEAAEKAAEEAKEDLAAAQAKAEMTAANIESIRHIRAVLLALAEANKDVCEECEEALKALKEAEERVASLSAGYEG